MAPHDGRADGKDGNKCHKSEKEGEPRYLAEKGDNSEEQG